jgi:single-strand DNA-binding protein
VINNCVLVGRLTRDPEMRYTQNGIAVTSFSIAVDRPFGRDEEGNKQTDFIDIVTWRKTAELAGQYLGKGAMVGVEGRIQVRSYTTQDGQQRRAYEVVAERIAFLESKAERERREARQQSAGPQATPPPPPEPPAFPDAGPEPVDVTDGDDPFGDQ